MLECGLRAVVLHNKEVVWNYYAEFTTDCRRINTNLLSGVQCAVVNCSTNSPALYPWNTSDYINSINWLVILSSDSNSYSVYSISGNKKIICAEEYPGESNTPKPYLSDGKIYVSLKNHELKYDVLIVRFGKYIPKNG